MQTQNRFLNNAPYPVKGLAGVISRQSLSTFLTAALVAITLSSCGKTETKMSVSERVKLVEERQKSDPNFYKEKKAGETAAINPRSDVPAVSATAEAAPPKGLAKM